MVISTITKKRELEIPAPLPSRNIGRGDRHPQQRGSSRSERSGYDWASGDRPAQYVLAMVLLPIEVEITVSVSKGCFCTKYSIMQT